MKKECKICLNAMVGNEERVILRMLESSYKYIDYWVVQCNGSDKTQSIIEEFYKEKNIPGFTYNHEWDYPGVNRDHTLQTALKSNHECDWILRMDADEQLEVDDDFDWTPLNDTSIQSYNMTAMGAGSIYFRTWLWNANIPWKFEHDRRHECIYIDGVGEASIFCGAIIGSCLGFLWFNAPPAKIFMGDTGSLALGGSLGAVGIITKHEIVLAITGGLFVLEAVSVIAQVISFKLTGRRIFKMAPIHHHFEKKGWPESTVVIRFWIISIILAMIGLATLKLR